ncbi:MAG: histidine kinase [Candidatus Thiodiazotropha endolucinida]
MVSDLDKNTPANTNEYSHDYQLARRYGITSFIAIILIAVIILLLFRYESSRIIQDSAKQSNESLTIATEYALNDHFVMYLNLIKLNKKKPGEMPFDPLLARAIRKMIKDTNVDRIKLYDVKGRVAYSSNPSAYTEEDEDNDGFKTAIAGYPRTVLNYRDSLTIFNNNDRDVNLVQTYVPIRVDENSPVLGVMEIYYDISGYVSHAMRTIIVLMLTTLLLMLFLYTFLLMHIKRSERIIEDQNRITREKKVLLEFLTAKMINAQEDEKKRIAFDLHEDVVQTLSGVKMQLEKYILSLNQQEKEGEVNQLSTEIVPMLQNAAHKIRAVAIDLRPPSLDDFGLKAALNSVVSECHTETSGLEIEIVFALEEADISLERKSILYRLVKDILHAICFEQKLTAKVQIRFDRVLGGLSMRVVITSKKIDILYREELPDYLTMMEERTILSGGEFSRMPKYDDTIEVKSIWAF